MSREYDEWAYDPQFNRIINRDLQYEIDAIVLRHPTEMLLAMAHARAQGGDLGTMESLGELFCLMDDLAGFRTAYGGRQPVNAVTK